MTIKEILSMMVRSFFIIVTGTVIGLWAGGSILMPDARFIPLGFGHILLTALIAVLFFFLFYSRRDLNRRQMAVRLIIHFCTLSPTMIFLVYHWNWIPWGDFVFGATAVGVYLLIYTAVFFFVFYRDLRTAKKLTNALKKRRKELDGNSK